MRVTKFELPLACEVTVILELTLEIIKMLWNESFYMDSKYRIKIPLRIVLKPVDQNEFDQKIIALIVTAGDGNATHSASRKRQENHSMTWISKSLILPLKDATRERERKRERERERERERVSLYWQLQEYSFLYNRSNNWTTTPLQDLLRQEGGNPRKPVWCIKITNLGLKNQQTMI